MTSSPRGYPFEVIAYDVGQMNTLHERLTKAKEAVEQMQLVLNNLTGHLEGSGAAIDRVRSSAGDVSAALKSPSDRIERLSGIVLRYGMAVEAHGGKANQLMADVTAAQTSLDTAHTEVVLAETELSTWTRSDDYRSWSAGEETATSSSTLLSRDDRFREAVTTAQGTRDRAAEDLADAWTAWEKEFEAWDDAYARAVASLARVDGGYVSTADAPSLAALADAHSPEEVAAIWDSMSEAERARIAASYPEFIGNLEGIPYEYRIAANVAVLEEASKTSWGEPRDGEIAKLLAELRKGGLPVSLNLFDKNQATAAMLYVDGFEYDPAQTVDPMDGVTNVTVLLGGMLTELSHVGDWGETASNVNKGVARDGGRGATIVWFGYDTPNYGTVGSMDQAVTGAESFTTFLRGLEYEAPRDAVTTVIGHSYGSTTAFLAVGSADDNLGVDNLIAVGSAGLADRALGDDPHARVDYSGTRIYASTSPEDNWARKGRWAPDGINVTRWGTHAIDPGSIDNAVSFDSNGGYGPNLDGSQPTPDHHDGSPLLQTPGHGTHDEGDWSIGTTGHPGGYLQDGSESFANIIEIINTGDPLTTPGGYGSDDWWLW